VTDTVPIHILLQTGFRIKPCTCQSSWAEIEKREEDHEEEEEEEEEEEDGEVSDLEQ